MPHRQDRDTTLSWVFATAPIPTGLVMALFNDRFISPSWRFAGGIPGGYATWSGVLLCCGVFMTIAMLINRHHIRHRVNRTAMLITGMIIVGLWWFLLGGLFLVTAIVDRYANPLGAVVWWTICAVYWTWAFYERRRL